MWKYKVEKINNTYHKIIKDTELNEVVVMVDNLDIDFLETIIFLHNKSIDKAFREGIELGREVYNKVYNNIN